MRISNRLGRIALVLTLLLSLGGSMSARTRKGDKFLKEGRKAEVRQEYDRALELYEEALLTDPEDANYQIAVRRVRFQAAQQQVHEGHQLRSEGQLNEALLAFQRAYAIDPSSSIARQEIRRTVEMIEQATKKSQAGQAMSPQEKGLTPTERARKEAEERVAGFMSVPTLKPISRQITSLKMNNQPVRVLYETVGKLAGINIMMDAEYQPGPQRNFSIDLSNTTLEEALDHLSILTKTYWKPLSQNTIFVTNDNPTKRRDYEEQVVKVFYLTNVTTPQELQEIHTAVRTLTDIRRMFPYNSLNAILIRGTADQVALAEKLIQDMDKPKSEVVLDVLVMEANRTRTRDLAATFLSGEQNGIRIPISFGRGAAGTANGNGGSGTSTAVPLGQLGSLTKNDWSLTLPGGFLQALMTDRTTKLLQSPQVRASDGMKSSLRIGDRFPYATGSFQPGIGGVGGGISPLVSTQFQFADVGVNVDVVPRIHTNGEVSLHVELEISAVRDRIDIGGLSQPVIGQRKVIHDIRIREGELTLLGGLMQNQDTRNVSGVPGLANVPILGRFFSGENIERNQGELLVALVPHVVRSMDISPVNIRGIAAGNDQVVKLTYAPPEESTPQPAEPKPAEAPTAPGGAVPAAEDPKPAQAAARLAFSPATAQAQMGMPITVSLQVENVTDIFTAPLRLKFDPKMVRLTEVKLGPFLSGDGQRVTFSENTLNDAGEAVVTLNRYPGSGGISGSGTLLTLTLQPLAQGSTQVTLSELGLRDSQLRPISVAAPMLTVNIQ